MSFPEMQPGYRVARSETKGFRSRERRGATAEDGSSRSQRAADLATLSEGICHCSLHPTPLAGPTACGTTKSPSAHRARELWEGDFAGRYPKIRDLKINRTRASLQ